MAGRPRVRVSGPLASFAAGFSDELARSGYTPLSARLQLQLMAHLSRWLASEEVDAAALTPALVERFLAARRSAGYANHRTAKGLEPLLGYLRAIGAAPLVAPAVAATPVEALLGRYRRYLLVERGLAEGTVRGYLDVVRPFLDERASVDGLDLERLTAADVERVRGRDLSRSARQGRLGEADGDRAALAAWLPARRWRARGVVDRGGAVGGRLAAGGVTAGARARSGADAAREL